MNECTAARHTSSAQPVAEGPLTAMREGMQTAVNQPQATRALKMLRQPRRAQSRHASDIFIYFPLNAIATNKLQEQADFAQCAESTMLHETFVAFSPELVWSEKLINGCVSHLQEM